MSQLKWNVKWYRSPSIFELREDFIRNWQIIVWCKTLYSDGGELQTNYTAYPKTGVLVKNNCNSNTQKYRWDEIFIRKATPFDRPLKKMMIAEVGRLDGKPFVAHAERRYVGGWNEKSMNEECAVQDILAVLQD